MESPEIFASEEEALEAKYDSGGEISEDEISPSESPPENELVFSESPISNEDFQRRVTRLMEIMNEDPSNRDRILAEIYVNMASAEMGIRGMFEAIQTQGMAGLMKGAFRRGR